MTIIGDPKYDPSFNTMLSPRSYALMTPEEIRRRPVWLTRTTAGDFKTPASPRNKRLVQTWYNNGETAVSAGAVFYKINKGGRGVWDIRFFCWMEDYDHLLEIMTPEEFLKYDRTAVTADFAVRHLHGVGR